MARARKTNVAPGSFAARLREWRKSRGWKQAYLEDRIGKAGGTVSGLEGGGTRYTQEHVELLCKAFNCNVLQFFMGPPDPAKPEQEIIARLATLNAEQKAVVATVVRQFSSDMMPALAVVAGKPKKRAKK